jgi:hypothetical protein
LLKPLSSSSFLSSLLALFLSRSPAVGLANNFLTCISSPFDAAHPPATPFGPPPCICWSIGAISRELRAGVFYQ